jgi:hypothetical protein
MLERSKLQKSTLGLSPSEDGFQGLETRHDRKVVPRPKLFVQQGDYRNKGLKPEKIVLVSSPSENVFCTLESNDDYKNNVNVIVLFYNQLREFV